MENITKIINENADSITIGSASKGGSVKIYGDFSKVEEFNKKIDNARKVKMYANANLMVNI
ncbi:MAG: hypothetical protein GON13_02150 [Nanoarchaeota archaeon]|nr:hypothetical protein [Nanoarchaeota archaeon]